MDDVSEVVLNSAGGSLKEAKHIQKKRSGGWGWGRKEEAVERRVVAICPVASSV